mmetsp:Transcript_47797/g.86111  ORF Transcript_47797/g.86111 Transcript_47797/m.86111 type:complete len:572 (+) Transcript_47797:89-1804(+)
MQPHTDDATTAAPNLAARVRGLQPAPAPAKKNLFSVVQRSSLEEVREALEKLNKLDISLLRPAVEGQTLLFSAVLREENALEVCRLLIDGFQIQPGQQDVRGQTAMHYLAKTRHFECVDLLVARSGNVDHVDSLVRQTPLFYAAHHSGGEMVRRLLELGADPDHKDATECTPLFWVDTLEAAVELVKHRGSCCAATDSKGLTAADWHRHQKREVLARFLSMCSEARAVRGRMSWLVRCQSIGGYLENGNKEPLVAYVTTLARQRDVDTLCVLEDEFIKDHDSLLGGKASRADLFSQIGLDQDAGKRRNTIKKIATNDPRKGPTRHYTLKCAYIPPADQKATTRSRTQETVGYVYFRVVDGEKNPNENESQAVARKGIGHIVVSHLKVSAEHQRRGVALLLLTGMLQTAEAEVRNMQCTALYLSVMESNVAAVNLYKMLGFASTGRNADHPNWIHMKLAVLPEPGPKPRGNLRILRKAWYQRLPGVSGGSSAEDSKAAALQATRKRKMADEEVMLMPAKRIGTMPPSPQASQISASTTASSESGSLAASDASGASSSSGRTQFISDYFTRRR